MSAANTDVGPQLRARRVDRGISQRELARRLGLSPSLISQIEKGQSRPSVRTLYGMVTELGLSLDELFLSGLPKDTKEADRTSVAISAAADGQTIQLESGVSWTRLAGSPDGTIDFLSVVYDVGGASSRGELQRHAGREYGYITQGQVVVQVGSERQELSAGDAIAFDSTLPHRMWNSGDVPAKGVWFIIRRQEPPPS
jgi:transcriptional regulator with XRE-family HTH domain